MDRRAAQSLSLTLRSPVVLQVPPPHGDHATPRRKKWRRSVGLPPSISHGPVSTISLDSPVSRGRSLFPRRPPRWRVRWQTVGGR